MTDNPRYLRASEIFRQVIELPEEQRDRFLRGVCAGDESLLAEVRSLLSYDGPEPKTIQTPFAVTDSGPLPEKFGRYQILGKIGQGGMGEVWKAWDPQLERHVALKFLPPDLARSEAARSRFLREGRNAATLKHIGIATVFDSGEIEERDYIAFEFVDGRSVTQHLKEGALPASEAVKVALVACDALAYAHERNVIHRDITSNNIMITNDGNVVIVDFGLAIAEGAEKVTRSGAVMGTVAYMAPESLKGAEPDARVDIYGLGVVLYEMLTGSLPFDNQMPHAIQYMIANQMPKRPSERDAALPAGVDTVVMKALAKDPAERYQSAHEFMAALDALLQPGVLPEVPGDRVIVRLPKTLPVPVTILGWRLRRRTIVAIGSVAVVLIAAALWLLPKPESYASVAVLPIEVTGPDTGIPTWMTSGLGRGLVSKLSKLEGVRVVTWTSSCRFLPSEKRPQEIAAELGVAALVIVRIQRIGDRFHGSWELVDGKSEIVIPGDDFDETAGDLFAIEGAVAMAVARKLVGRVEEATAGMLASPASRSLDAYEFYLRGAEVMQTGPETPESNDKALAHFERALELDPNLADAMVGVGAVLVNRYFYGWAGMETIPRAKEYFTRALALEPENRDALRGMIAAAYEQGAVSEVLGLARGVATGTDARLEDLLVPGQAYVLAGYAREALPLLRRAIEIEPSNPAVHWWLVITNCWAGDFEGCIRNADAYVEKFGEDPEVHLWTALAYRGLGGVDEAEVHFQRALDLFGDHPNDYAALYAAHFYREIDRSSEADQLIRESTLRLESVHAAYPSNERYLTSLADCYALLADTTKLLALETDKIVGFSTALAMARSYAEAGLMLKAREKLCNIVSGQQIVPGPFYGWFLGLAEAEAKTNDPAFRACLEVLAKRQKAVAAEL